MKHLALIAALLAGSAGSSIAQAPDTSRDPNSGLQRAYPTPDQRPYRRLALRPTSDDLAATARAKSMLAAGEMPSELNGLDFQTLADVQNGRLVLMRIVLFDFARKPGEHLEYEAGGKTSRYPLDEYTAAVFLLVDPNGKPLEIRIR